MRLGWLGYEVWHKSNQNVIFLPKFYLFIISNINVIPFKIVALGSYTPMGMLFPLLVAAMELFNRYDLQHVRYPILGVF